MKTFKIGWSAWALFRCLACGALPVVVAGACASAPPESFYTLSSAVDAAAVPSAAVSAPAFTRSVVVAAATLPETVDRPQLVTMAGGNRVEILEQKRWAEPLRAGIPRVVAESLSKLLGTWRVSGREDVIDRPDCRVNLDFRRFDTQLGAGAGVTIDALWTVACAGETKRMGQSSARQSAVGLHADSPYNAVVAAHGLALDAVSRDIARVLVEGGGSP